MTDLEELLEAAKAASPGERIDFRDSIAGYGGRAVSAMAAWLEDARLGLAGEATQRRRPDGTIERGYWASYFLRGVRNHGGPDYARQLLHAQGTSTGFQRLTDEGRLDLTVEALILKPEFAELFTDDERLTAARRLSRPQSAASRMNSDAAAPVDS